MRIALTLALLLAAAPAFAQSPAAQSLAAQSPAPAMPGMNQAAPAGAAPSTIAYQKAMARMDRGMSIPYTGNADQDFVAGMIPHHQGAIDMARVELRYGHDRALRRLARRIIKAQTREIAFMRRWQAHHRK